MHLFDEVKDLLRTDVICRDCEYVLTFRRPYDGMPPGSFVLRRELTFHVAIGFVVAGILNLTGGARLAREQLRSSRTHDHELR